MTGGTGELPREPPPKIEREQIDVPSIVRRHESVLRARKIPDYPILARTASVQGDVQVEIVIDENGDVVAASQRASTSSVNGASNCQAVEV